MPSINRHHATRLALISFASATLLLALSACGRTAGPLGVRQPNGWSRVQASAVAHYPLEQGLRWDYVLRQTHQGHPMPERSMTMGIAESTRREDGSVEATLQRRYKDLQLPATRVVADGSRVVLARAADPLTGPSLTILRWPASPGDVWQGRPLPTGNSEAVVVIGEETVEVPAGRWKALRVDHRLTYADGDGDVLSYWYAQGVGCVRMIERTTVTMGGEKHKLAVEGLLTARVSGGWPSTAGAGQPAPAGEWVPSFFAPSR